MLLTVARSCTQPGWSPCPDTSWPRSPPGWSWPSTSVGSWKLIKFESSQNFIWIKKGFFIFVFFFTQHLCPVADSNAHQLLAEGQRLHPELGEFVPPHRARVGDRPGCGYLLILIFLCYILDIKLIVLPYSLNIILINMIKLYTCIGI